MIYGKKITAVLSILLAIVFASTGNETAAASAAKPLEFASDSRNEVYFLPQFSEFTAISESELSFFRKTIDRAAENKVKAVILEMDTPGGSVETAFKYLSLMEKSPVPIVVYLNPNGISAGMIIALGADRIVISPNGLIGDAMPIEMGLNGMRPITDKPESESPAVSPKDDKSSTDQTQENQPNTLDKILQEIRNLQKKNISPADKEAQKLAEQKFLTVFFKMLQVLSEKNQRPVKVIRAMADPYTRLDKKQDGISHTKRSPLTLSAREALELGVVDHIAANRADLLAKLGLKDAKVVEIKRSPTEQIGAFLAVPAIAGLLLIIGLVGIFVEIKTPGFGVPGVLGVAALTLFFLGHMAAGSSNWGPMVIFFVGLLLLALEIFVIPGFGLVGALGILCILISFFAAFGLDNISSALRVITVSLLLAIIIMILLAVYVLPSTALFRKTSLDLAMKSADGFKAQSADESLIGSSAVAITPLRPSGVIRIGSSRHDAASEGEFLEPGEEVIVTGCNGFQLIVQRKNV